MPTRAGSKINRDRPPARADATALARLEAAGAVLIGSLNMGEYAYDFTGQNAHDGPSRNPHDLEHMTGGSSGGSGAAVAGGLVPIALGSDTNGSIRVPSSLCGLFGLKPTYGRLSRAGAFPFVASLDHVGPIARSVGDLALAYDAMLGRDEADPAQADMPATPASPTLRDGVKGLRIAKLGGYFARSAEPSAIAAVDTVARALKADRVVELAGAEQARSAAYLITMVEGAALHLERLRTRLRDFDPDVGDRLIAGAMLPGAWIAQAQKFRRRFRTEALALFRDVDILLAPATPCRAPKLGQKTFVLDGREMLVRAHLGLFTQPISFIGLPVVVGAGVDRRRKAADRGADHRRAVARGSRAPRRPGAGAGRRCSRAGRKTVVARRKWPSVAILDGLGAMGPRPPFAIGYGADWSKLRSTSVLLTTAFRISSAPTSPPSG